MDLRGHYLNRCDQEQRDLVALFDAFPDALSPLMELSATIQGRLDEGQDY